LETELFELFKENRTNLRIQKLIISLKSRLEIPPAAKLEDLPDYKKTLTEVKEECHRLLDSAMIVED
jgi:hypothetical protein